MSIRRPSQFEYRDMIEAEMRIPLREKYAPCVIPNWDNTPRSEKRGEVLDNATPDLFELYLKNAIGKVLHKPYQERIVFLKAWNEWAERKLPGARSRNGLGVSRRHSPGGRPTDVSA